MNYLKITVFIFLIICLTNCVSRNEYGIVRPNKIRFSNKNCEDEHVYKKVDTSAIYLSEIKTMDTGKPFFNGYKFYSNNKVAFFINIKIDSINSLNPKNAQMGFYNTCAENNTIQTSLYHVQSGIFKSKEEFKIYNDTLIIKTLESPQAIFRIEKYYKRKLKPSELIYKPDW